MTVTYTHLKPVTSTVAIIEGSTVASLYQRLLPRPPAARGCGSRRASSRRFRRRRSCAAATAATARPSASCTTLNRGSSTLRLRHPHHGRRSRRPSLLQHPPGGGGRPPGAAAAIIPLCSGPSLPRSPPPSSVHASTLIRLSLRCLYSPLYTRTSPPSSVTPAPSAAQQLASVVVTAAAPFVDHRCCLHPQCPHQGMDFAPPN